MDNFEPYIPPKPNLVRKERNGHPAVTVFSMVLFALTFSILINDYLFIAFLLLVILFHEAGHFLTMKLFGYEKLKMLFIPFLGALVQGKKRVYSQTQSALVLLAGPIPGMIVGFVLLEFGLNDESFWMLQLGVLFILLNAVNLLPIDPLDGGQLIRVMILGKSELFQLIFSFLSSLALIGLGVWLDSYVLIIFGFLLGFRVKTMYAVYFIRKDMKEEGINYETTYEKLSDLSYARIKRILISNKPVLTKIQDEVDEMHFNQLMANQVDSVLQEPMKRDVGFLGKFFFLSVWLIFLVGTFYYFFSIDLNQLTDAFRNR